MLRKYCQSMVNGNICTKNNMEQYSYSTTSMPHAVNVICPIDGIPEYGQYIEYTPWNKVECISHDDADDYYYYHIEYGPDQQRVRSSLYKNGVLQNKKFYWDGYEEYLYKNYNNSDVTVWSYWIEAPDGLAGFYWNSSDEYYLAIHPCVAITDHLGSLTGLYDHNGNKTLDATYDAWGKRTFAAGSMQLDRGFTGHEHIDALGLINMNGRMYDPLQGRFLSPDNYIQSPDNPQNYNRYSYCLNNPLKYTDPDGEKISWLWGLAVGLNLVPIEAAMAFVTVSTTDAITSGLVGLFDGGTDEAANRATNSIKIASGILQSDENDGDELFQFGGSFLRSIWCSPSSLLGYAYACNANFFDRVDVDDFYGATVLRSKWSTSGVTLGHYIMINSDFEGEKYKSTLIHEYGHFMQSRGWGGFSALSGSIYSLASALNLLSINGKEHYDVWIEKDASARGASHLENEYNSIKTKYDNENPQEYYDLRMLHNMFIPFSLFSGIYNIFNPN